MVTYEINTAGLVINKKKLMDCILHAKETYTPVKKIEVITYDDSVIILNVEEDNKDWHRSFGKLVKSKHGFNSDKVFTWRTHTEKTSRFGG